MTKLEELRSAIAARTPQAAPGAFVLDGETLIRTGLGSLDAALGGGFPRGIIATLEGRAGAGRSAIAGRLLSAATANGGLGALIESPGSAEGSLYPPALASAGIDLKRLLIVPAHDARSVARAADIIVRSGAFGVVVIPAVKLAATAWTRLASLTHRAGALLVALGVEAPDELRYFASLRIEVRPSAVQWAGESGPFCALAGASAEAIVLKHKRAAPGGRAQLARATFETEGPPLAALRERTLPREGVRQPSFERIIPA
ncbi:MAG: hypothetical protein JO293_05080 [Candidatus Eremiobacteraeota bacterium]|nr:hypothetical protein [Candidatus Eremiobacteraeota bacterium]